MNFEIGKYYKTRSGEKAKLVHVFDNGLMLFANDETYLTTKKNGNAWNGEPYIISEWVEPRSVDVWIGHWFENGTTWTASNDFEKSRYANHPIAWKKVTFTEGEE